MSDGARQNYRDKGEMIKDLWTVLYTDTFSRGTKIAVAEEIFATWSEWYGKIWGGGLDTVVKNQKPEKCALEILQKIGKNQGSIPLRGRYWSKNALKAWPTPSESKLLSFEHLVPRSELRACFSIPNVSKKNPLGATLKKPEIKFQSQQELGDFLEKFCVGVVLHSSEQKTLDGKIENGGCGLRQSMPDGFCWAPDFRKADEWARYRRLADKLPELEIYDLLTGKAVRLQHL